MSEKPKFVFNTPILTNESMGVSITSEPFNVSEVNNVSLQAIWSAGATPIGITLVQYSLDGINFSTDTDSILPVSGNTGNNIYNIRETGFKYIRIIYTRTSGSGTLNALISGKL